MEKDYLSLKRASASRPSGEWNDDDYDVLANGEVVGRIFKVNAAPVGNPWMWTLAFGYRRDRAPNHGYAATRGRHGCIRQELAAPMKESPGRVPGLQVNGRKKHPRGKSKVARRCPKTVMRANKTQIKKVLRHSA
jgi:hypothetical protein